MYGTLEAWRTYATERGNSAPGAADDDLANAALVRASDYIKYQYVSRLLPGYDDTLDIIEPATYEAAALELATPNFFTKTYTPGQQTYLSKVGSISFSHVGTASKGFATAVPRSVLIEGMFEPYTEPRDGEHGGKHMIKAV